MKQKKKGNRKDEAKEDFEEEGYEKEFNKFKTRKEVSIMHSESILIGFDVR